MHFSTVVAAALALLATPILGSPTTPLIAVEKYSGNVKESSYIVTLKENVSKSTHLAWLSQHLGSDTVTHTEWQTDLLHGFAGKIVRSSCAVDN